MATLFPDLEESAFVPSSGSASQAPVPAVLVEGEGQGQGQDKSQSQDRPWLYLSQSQSQGQGSQPARPGSQLEASEDMFDISGSEEQSEPSQLEGSRLEEWEEMVERGANARGRVASTPGKTGLGARSPSASPVRSQEPSQALVRQYQPGQVVRLGGVVSAVRLAHCRQVQVCTICARAREECEAGWTGRGGPEKACEWGSRVSWKLEVECTLEGQTVVLGDLTVRRLLGLGLDSYFRAWVSVTGKVMPEFVGIVAADGRVMDLGDPTLRGVGAGPGGHGADEVEQHPVLNLEDRVEVYEEQVDARTKPMRVDLRPLLKEEVGGLRVWDRADTSSDSSDPGPMDAEGLARVRLEVQGVVLPDNSRYTLGDKFPKGECAECGALVPKSRQLQHLRDRHGGAAFDCPDCDTKCSQAHHLAAHRERKHGAGGPREECPSCGKDLARTAVVSHMETQHHTKVRKTGTFRMCGPSGTIVDECSCGKLDMEKGQFAKSLSKQFACG